MTVLMIPQGVQRGFSISVSVPNGTQLDFEFGSVTDAYTVADNKVVVVIPAEAAIAANDGKKWTLKNGPTTVASGSVQISPPVSSGDSLSGLDDVALANPVDGQVLKFNGTSWVNDDDLTAGEGGGATDLSSTPGPTSVLIASSTGGDATISAATTSNAGVMSAADKTKLTGIATGATANDTNANLRDRSTHTGSQAISTITNLQAALDDTVSVGTFQSHTHTVSQVTDFTTAVDARIQNVIGAAPIALDTLDELAAALGDDANFASTVTTSLAGKAPTNVVPDGGATDEALVKVNATNRNTTWKRMLKWFGDVVTLPNSLQQFLRVDIPSDGSDTATWPDRLAFYFNGTRTGYFNEYGEVRARAASPSTVALRTQGHVSNTTTDVFQATTSDNNTIYFAAGPAGLKGPGTIRAISATQPNTTGWVAGEFWYDTSTEA